jgi:hypothetical protein
MEPAFKSSDEAKEYAINATAAYLDENAMQTRINDFTRYLANASSEQDKIFWHNQIQELEVWRGSDAFINGLHPQGIDELILELLELRALVFAFQCVELKNNPFAQYVFFSQWVMGITYVTFSIIGKLSSKNPKDNSLRGLWQKVAWHINDDNAFTAEEIQRINTAFDNKDGHFSNGKSPAILVRNKSIAHNEFSPKVYWDDIDDDIKILVRTWSMITSWSSMGLIQPFRDSKQAFAGLESLLAAEEIRELSKQRECYIQKTRQWAITRLHDGSEDAERSPFAKISVGISRAPNSQE